MKILGTEVHVQRGERFSLDFTVMNTKGHPFVVLKNWQNPYLVITVSSSLYKQNGDYKENHWLDLKHRWVEQSDGSGSLEDVKTFLSAEPLFLSNGFYVSDVRNDYGGKIIFDDETSDFNIKNFLFFTDPNSDGKYVYKYVKSYTKETVGEGDEAEEVEVVEWADYGFNIIKQFDTKNWIEQRYLFDIKVLTGESVQEHLTGILETQGTTQTSLAEWSNEDWESYIMSVENETVRAEMRQYYDEGAPLMPTYDTNILLLQPTPIYVSTNIQGG